MGGGVGFEFGGKVEKEGWKNGWDWVILFGSVFGGVIFGMLF